MKLKIIACIILLVLTSNVLFSTGFQKFRVHQDGKEYKNFIWTEQKLTYKDQEIDFASEEVKNNFIGKQPSFLFPKSFEVVQEYRNRFKHKHEFIFRQKNKEGHERYYLFDVYTYQLEYLPHERLYGTMETIAEISEQSKILMTLAIISSILGIIAFTSGN
ncbi:hypothetical protein ACFL56_00230 [Candidatus Margulisiibacteriota bacterium]